jgi:UDP-N-acetylmuramoyl-tripeptide--D-alanyl-D-alanine ligase
MMSLAEAHALLPGSRLVGDGTRRIQRVHSDSRTLQRGDLFVALRGERFDGHDFLGAARAAGAAAAVAERGLDDQLPGLQVPDVQHALSTLAAGWRSRFRGPLVAVTGSNGKTTVTQMIAAVLRAWLGPAALATEGNHNNHIGLPLTVLRLRPQQPPWHRAAVVELGMNHPGEIAQLAAIARPTIGLVNNAQREHQEFMASVEAVARENGSVIEALPRGGTAVFPAADPHAGLWHALAAGRPTLTFADAEAADTAGAARAPVVGRARWQAAHVGAIGTGADGWQLAIETPVGPLATRLRLAGRHNVHNALAATACAVAAGVPAEAIARGLAAFEPVGGRSRLLAARLHGRPLALVDDSYNANPDSVRAAIELLAGLPGPRWLVLGDMGEVGERGPAFHREVGTHAARCGIESLWGVGRAARDAVDAFAAQAGTHAAASRHFADVDALLAATRDSPAAASALVKGSRFMRLERVVAALAGTGQAGGH